MTDAEKQKLRRFGLTELDKPKRTPKHADKSHIVATRINGDVKIIRFGQQGAENKPPRKNETRADAAKRAAFKKRHAKNIAKGKSSAAYWADRVKW